MTHTGLSRCVHSNHMGQNMRKTDYDKPCMNGIERRSGRERRTHSFVTLMRALHGRRSLGRRDMDQAKRFFDRYEAKFLFVSLSILVLCGADALFTLSLIDAGIATEANPIMRWVMEESIHLFWISKLSITILSLLILLALKNFYFMRCIKVSYLLYGTLAMYAVLIKYELWLFGLEAIV